MPESRIRRKKASAVALDDSRKPVRVGSGRWVAPTMVTLFVVGLVWIVVWYIAPDNALMRPLTFWNVVIGFVLIGAGFVTATRWK
ncbi:MAG: cell division protein CrgA [Actinomycetota bacterium]|nr:MAG: cell division protein CrgA [Actinomycetota bacterium]